MSCTWERAQQIPFGNPAFGRTPFVCLKLARRREPLNCAQSGWSHRRTCCFSCRVWMENVCSAIAKVALRVTSILSSRSGEATDFPCLLECDRCGKCTLTTLTCSRCVTGKICKGSSLQVIMRVWSSREKGTNVSKCRAPGKEVVRALQTNALGDQIDFFQGMISPPAVFVRELVHFTLATLNFKPRVGRKWMQILAGRWVWVFQFRREGMSCFNAVWKFVYSCHGRQILPSAV